MEQILLIEHAEMGRKSEITKLTQHAFSQQNVVGHKSEYQKPDKQEE